jgi:nucleotide-binding universal stress UspA family protein
MTYTSIMVGLDLGAGSRERTRLAAQLAERFQARLIGVGARQPDYPRASGEYPLAYGQISVLGGSAMEEIRKAALADVAAIEESFRAVAGAGRHIEWRSGLKDPEIFLEEQSRAADLVVIGRPGGQDLSDPRLALNAGVALMALGRPVLVVPPGVDHLSLKRIVVAWKNTLQTRRAISDAMPLLKLAEQVQVVRISAPEDHEDVEDVVRFLGLHSVNAVAFRKSQNGASVALALQGAAKAFGADLIVSGAYGHNRIREWFFGGVTRALLDHCPVCCLMSH